MNMSSCVCVGVDVFGVIAREHLIFFVTSWKASTEAAATPLFPPAHTFTRKPKAQWPWERP